MHRFGTSVRKDPKREDWPGPGDTNVPSYTKGEKTSHNRKKTLFTTKELELDPATLKLLRDKVSSNKMKFKGDSLGPGQ